MNIELLDQTLLGNSLWAYLRSASILIVGWGAVRLLRAFLINRLMRSSAGKRSSFTGFLVDSIKTYAVPIFYFWVFNLAARNLTLTPSVAKGFSAVNVVVLTAAAVLFISRLARYALVTVYPNRRPDQPELGNRLNALMPAVTVLIWMVGIVFLLDNLGFEVSAIMAGLGIGGVAVALAASVVLNDLFAYFAIMFDEPFVIGDFIIIGDYLGTIERIGVKTTRIRSLGGELLIFSNKDLTDSRIRNYKRMERRRVVFQFGVSHETALASLKEIPGLVKGIITGRDDVLFDRAHFASHAESSLLFEVVYHVLSADYNVYMDIQQDINFAIREAFESRGVRFAIPAHAVYVRGAAGEPKAPDLAPESALGHP